MTIRPASVRCPLLIGRDDLLALADRRLADAASGKGQFLLVSGEAGIGKTRFMDAVGQLARERGFVEAWGALAPQDRDVPAASILDLVMARGWIAADEPWRPLTGREFAVARLVGQGMTNAEIAESLGIAPKTASAHIEHILAKLGAGRRAEIATWASHIEPVGVST